MHLKIISFLIFLIFAVHSNGMQLLIPMDETQKDHLKSYGIAYWVLEKDVEVKWLLN